MKKLLTLLLSFLFITTSFSQKRNITLEDIWKNYTFYPKTYNQLNSMNDGEYYSKMEKKDEEQEIIKYQFKDGKKIKTLFNSANFEIPKITNYTFSKDEKQVLLATKTEKIYRYSSKSIYYIYNIFTDKLRQLTDKKVMYATFSPQGDKIAYILDNNLFIQNIIDGEVIDNKKDET